MGIAVTVGAISASAIQELSTESVFCSGLSNILEKFSGKFQLLEANSSNHQLLLSVLSPEAVDREDIRLFLKELQQLTMLPYVALMNPSMNLILVTVRG
ncbi:MAG: hypothetical protein ACFFBD_02335 [Candidatus Hodarchaeota archaeon]